MLELVGIITTLLNLLWTMILAGLILSLFRFSRIGVILICIGVLCLYITSLPIVVYPIAKVWQGPIGQPASRKAQAIVVLGAGLRPGLQYGRRLELTAIGRDRVAYAAWLAQKTHLPILLSGGRGHLSEAHVMAVTLKEDYHLKPKWLENQSETTCQNAFYSAKLLKQFKVHRIYLVTQAWHMRRAAWAFRKAGFDVIPAPSGYFSPSTQDRGWLRWFPNAKAQLAAGLIWHEYLGYWWYRLGGCSSHPEH